MGSEAFANFQWFGLAIIFDAWEKTKFEKRPPNAGEFNGDESHEIESVKKSPTLRILDPPMEGFEPV